MIGRIKEEELGLLDARERRRQKDAARTAAVERAARDVLSGDLTAEEAARNRGVPVARVHVLVRQKKGI